MKQSDVKLRYSALCVLRDIKIDAMNTVINFWECAKSLFSLVTSIVVLATYSVCYPFGKYVLLPRAIKRAEKATEEHMNRMFPDKVKIDEANK